MQSETYSPIIVSSSFYANEMTYSIHNEDEHRLAKLGYKQEVKPSSSYANEMTYSIHNEDEHRLAKLGYKQEVKRIFSAFTNYGLASSMISVLLGFIPLYGFELQSGGPAVMFWSWIICGCFCFILVSSLAEICSAYPTMGALYYWSYRLGGEQWGPFASWMSGWLNLLGQLAGVSSGAYAGANIFAGTIVSNSEVFGLFTLLLVIAGIVNTFAEVLLTGICYFSVIWSTLGILIIVIWMLIAAPSHQTAEFVFFHINNETGFQSISYVALIGSLAAASIFTGYDTASHVAEETTDSHTSTPRAMVGSVMQAFILGIILVLGMNFSIQGNISSILNQDDGQAYTSLWQQTVGTNPAIFFLVITLVAIECSNCANLTSCARMIYSFSRDDALPYSSIWYHIDATVGSPVRAIWLSIFCAWLLGMPGLGSDAVLEALFSLTATGLYASYIIPILLRVTISRTEFQPREFNLGSYSIPLGSIAVLWGLFMVVVLCLPNTYPITIANLNYSPVVLGIVLIYALTSWFLSAKVWFKGAIMNKKLMETALKLNSMNDQQIEEEEINSQDIQVSL